jgi:cell division septation protein DedD
MRSPLAGALVAAALVLALSGIPSSATAQSDPRLVDAVRAAQEGRGDSARTIVDRLLAATPPTDTLFPQILYTQAMVAGTAGDMRRLLQRVTVEYGTSSWADDALLRLVQMDYATRNFDAAARNLERLKLDFPATPLLPQAAYWAGRTYFDANNPSAACRWLADGMAQARNDVEVQNQLGYLYQRCDLRADTGAQAAATDTGRVDSTGRVPPGAQATSTPPPGAPSPGTPSPAAPPIGAAPTPAPVPIQPPGAANAPPSAAPPPASPPAAAAPAARTIYRVQIAAVVTRKGADDAARKARPLGLSVVTVEEKGLYKVRLGEYPTREAAQNAAASLKARLGGNPFVVAGP